MCGSRVLCPRVASRGVGQADDQRSSRSAMSKPGDVHGRFPEVYRISKYNGMGTESNQDRKRKHIK